MNMKFKDYKGENWEIQFNESPQRTLYKGELYWKIWVDVPVRPYEFRKYPQVPLPVFDDWWSYRDSIPSL